MTHARFQNFEALKPNSAERQFWDSLRRAFENDECIAFFKYPIFHRNGDAQKIPDVIFLHRRLGLWVFECKGCRIDNIASIDGAIWSMANWHREQEMPTQQAEDGMFAIRARFEERRETRGLLSFHYRVALPGISQAEWQERGWHDHPCTRGVVLIKDDLRPAAMRAHLEAAMAARPQTPLDDQQWAVLCANLSGTLPRPLPRSIPTGTPAQSPVRVINEIEGRIKALDETQLNIAFRIPEGPQRIRGLAGTGKTVLFCKRIAKIHAIHPEWSVAFVFFTRSLYDQVLSLIRTYYADIVRDPDAKPDWSKVQILHAWGGRYRQGFYRNLALRSGQRALSVNDVESDLGRRASPAEAFEYVCDRLEESAPSIPVLFDAIAIDEGQDLPPSFYRLALASLAEPSRLYWAYDEAQGLGTLVVPRPLAIFGSHSDGSPVVDLGGNLLPDGSRTGPNYPSGARKAESMARCYRTPRMLLMAAHAVNMGLLREEGALQGPSNQTDWERIGYQIEAGDFSAASVSAGREVTISRPDTSSPHPIDASDFVLRAALGCPLSINTFESDADELDWIATQIANDLKQGLDPWDLMVTGPTGPRESDYFRDLQHRLRALDVSSVIAGVDTSKDVFRPDGAVTISTIFRAKGNEAAKVYACRFQYSTRPLAFRDEIEIHKRNEAFVALTRARVWCVVTGIEALSPIFDELRAVVEQSPTLTFPAFNRSTLRRVNDEEIEESGTAGSQRGGPHP
jgi:superfamily I DNA and RNA helicase